MSGKEELPKFPSEWDFYENPISVIWWRDKMVDQLQKRIEEDLEKIGLATSDMERTRYYGRRDAWKKVLESLKSKP